MREQQQPQRTAQFHPPATPPSPRQRRFRWNLLLVPAIVVFGAWAVLNSEAHGTSNALLARWRIMYEDPFSALVLLGIGLVATLLIVKVLIASRDDDES